MAQLRLEVRKVMLAVMAQLRIQLQRVKLAVVVVALLLLEQMHQVVEVPMHLGVQVVQVRHQV
tara:strand:- start:437 stop:625 length:189 start_codon:yes stop_codon:yes gene_type:complete